jgi:hypothetical protein
MFLKIVINLVQIVLNFVFPPYKRSQSKAKSKKFI